MKNVARRLSEPSTEVRGHEGVGRDDEPSHQMPPGPHPKKHYDIDIEPLSEAYVIEVAHLHLECFPEKIESLLGAACIADVLRSRYLGPQRDSFCRIAVLKNSRRRLAAYVCGLPLGPRENWPYVFIGRSTLRRHLLRRLWVSPRVWRFMARRMGGSLRRAGFDESDVLQSTPRTEVVNMLAVRPDCRGGSIAADLMRDYEAEARGRNTRRLHLLVQSGNVRAERLYASLGWQRTCPDVGRFAVFAMFKELGPPPGNAHP